MNWIKHTFFILLSIIVFFSCSEKPKDDIVNMKDIIPSSKNYQEGGNKGGKVINELSFSDSLPSSYKEIIDSLKLDYKVIKKLNLEVLPDRFGSLTNQKFYWTAPDDSIVFLDWKFKDSLKTSTAFYNWLDCYGKNCRSIKVGEKVSFQKRSILLFVNDIHIILIDSEKKINQELWLKLFKDNGFGENWKYIISQPKKGKAKWMSYKDEILTEVLQKI